MDLLGSFLCGLIVGVILMWMFIKWIAKRNKEKFLNSLVKELPSQIPENELILNAIGSNLDQLLHHHGEKVDIISYESYVSCMVDGKVMMLPSSCLIKST